MKTDKTKYIICNVCGGTMGNGIALNSAIEENSLGMYIPANAKTLRFIKVKKCVDCGRSIDPLRE